MINEDELAEIEARLAAASGSSWELARTSAGDAVIKVLFDDGREETLQVTREREPATVADVEFIAAARCALTCLVDALRGRGDITSDEVAGMEAMCNQASPGPWRLFLEDDGGVGGSNVIWVSDRDDEPDLYLWLGSGLAPNDDFEFVAAARQDVPRLIAAIRSKGAES